LTDATTIRATMSANGRKGARMEDQGGSDPVVITIPADARFIRLVRLATSGMASLAGFDVELMDDLKIGVGEICATLIELGSGGPIEVAFYANGDRAIKVMARTDVVEGASVDEPRFALSRQILQVISDEHRIELSGDEARFELTMSAREHAADTEGA
jgi:serine/threonine-protein kinase RsbW